MSKQTKQPGDTLIGIGAMLAILGVVVFLFAVVSGGAGNAGLSFGMIVIGLLVAVVGYLQKRRA
ncbi:hypothetical protein PV761_03215 [Arthrobacter sp. CC3]|uniref:hypothetical protein n=1 Tax=Arthrobacter sp. CC3 TaxID=3029185 RepID=UPI0032653837